MSSENLSTTPSLRTIESAIELIDFKKDELKKAFDDLEANSLHLSSFSISWSDLNSHFTAIENSVTQRFRLLESRQSSHHPVDAVLVSELARCSTHPPSSKQGNLSSSKPLTRQDGVDSVIESNASRPLNCEQPSSSNSVGLQTDGSAPASSRIDSVVTRPELKEFCERMDGKGLRKYINDRVKEREAIRMELPGALKSAPDPGAMVLDAMEGFYAENAQSKGDKDPELLGLRRACVFLLEQLMETGVTFSEEVRESAKKLALKWKARASFSKVNSLEILAFLHLVATYSLGAVIDKEELVGYIFITAGCRQATMLCRSIDLGEKIHDLIRKLLDNGKQLLAVRFVFEFGLAEKFPPVPLLEDYLKETKKLAEQVCKDGKNSLKSLNVATAKEIGALKSVIKVIEECKLETEYSQECLQKRIEQLEKQQADRKPTATPPAAKPQQQQPIQQASQQAKKEKKKQAQGNQQQSIQQAKKEKKKQAQGKQKQSGNKRPKTTASVIASAASFGVAGSSSAVPPFQQPHLQPAGLFPDQSAAYWSLPAGPYGLAGSNPAVNPYVGSSAALYGLAGAPIGFSATPNPAASHSYSYDRLPTYGAYGLPPQYHPSYHPQ